MTRIHTIGDSHATCGWTTTGFPIKIHHLGAKTCFSVGRDRLEVLDFARCGVEELDYVILCFGEIDCRCHIHKYVQEDNTYQEIIHNVTEHYFMVIAENVAQYGEIRVAVFNVPPPVRRHGCQENPDYPFLGTDQERRAYVQYFNARLEELCRQHGYYFFNVYDVYADREGFLDPTLSDGNVHILSPGGLGEELWEWVSKYV